MKVLLESRTHKYVAHFYYDLRGEPRRVSVTVKPKGGWSLAPWRYLGVFEDEAAARKAILHDLGG